MAFSPSSRARGSGLSVDLEREIIDAGISPIAHVSKPPWIGAVRLGAGAVRDLGFLVGFNPIAGTARNLAANPFHGEIWGIATKAHQRSLMRIASWFIPIRDCALSPDQPAV